MESTENNVSEYNEQIKYDHLTELQRKVFEALRQMNVHRYCPPASQIAERADLVPNKEMNLKLTKETLKDLCTLGIVIWRINTETKDETYRLCKPEEFIRKERSAMKNGGPVSPRTPERISTESVKNLSPRVLQCGKCDFVTRSYAGLQIHTGQKHKTAASIKRKVEGQAKVKRMTPDPPAKVAPLITVTLTVNEALSTGIAVELVREMYGTCFGSVDGVSEKLYRAIIDQVPRRNTKGVS